MFVLGTAGHVDHGKSTLLRALTGMEPDRLPEEKKRGMTIDLNFVWLDSQNCGRVGIVDVPGHQKFVGNMVSGLSAIDAFVFVVAADDGWMPQSEEHFRLLKGLGITRGVAIITKGDLVSPETEEALLKEVERRFKEAGFANVAVGSFSSERPESKKKVLSLIEGLLSSLPKPEASHYARLWVDRVFNPRGQGNVVTGTLREGSLAKGAEVFLYPSGEKAGARTLQSHGEEVTEAVPDCRLAIQLGSVKNLKRGELLSLNPKEMLSKTLDVWLEPFTSFAPKRTLKVGFHLGTFTCFARWTTLKVQEGGVTGRLTFSSPVPVRALDRFILRTSGEEKTVGCGRVLDGKAEKVKLSLAKELLSKTALEAPGLLEYLLRSHQLLSLEDCGGLSGAEAYLSPKAVEIHKGEFLEKTLWEKAKALPGEISEKDAIAKLSVSKQVASRILSSKKERVSSPALKVDDLASVIKRLLPKDEPTSLAVELKDSKTKALLQKLITDKQIIRLAEDHFLTEGAYRRYATKVEKLIREKGQATTSELKDLLGLSRKFAVMILERLDSDRVTYLKEGVRKLLKG